MVTPFIGEILLYAFNFAPSGWAACDGQLMAIPENIPLFDLIHNEFGGNGDTDFALPDLTHINPEGLQYCIALTGVAPNSNDRPSGVGEVSVIPYAAPDAWFLCDGTLLEIEQYGALHMILGDRFGGDGITNFGLPKLGGTPPQYPNSLDTSMYSIAGTGGDLPGAPFLGEVRRFPYLSAPEGWMSCEGQPMSIAENSALFSLLGTTFGGDGIRTFALPNLTSLPFPGLEYFIAVNPQDAFPPR